MCPFWLIRNIKNHLSEIYYVLYKVYDISLENPSFLEKYFGIKGDTLYFSPSINVGIQKKNVPQDFQVTSF
jgi:hypothetical protein